MKKSVLVIDDDTALRAAVAATLREQGYEVRDGIETVHSLRSAYPEARIIAMSGGSARRGTYDFLHVAKKVGADRCLRKPFRTAELLAAVREVSAS